MLKAVLQARDEDSGVEQWLSEKRTTFLNALYVPAYYVPTIYPRFTAEKTGPERLNNMSKRTVDGKTGI